MSAKIKAYVARTQIHTVSILQDHTSVNVIVVIRRKEMENVKV